MPKLTDNSPMPFGKHKGTAMANVPADYLMFLYDNNKLTQEVKEYIDSNMFELKSEINQANNDD